MKVYLLPDLIPWGVYTFLHRVLKKNLVNGVMLIVMVN